MDYRAGLYFLNFLNVVFNAPETFYTVHLDKYTFESAQQSCESDGSFLTDMVNEEETSKIVKAIEDKVDENLTLFWIGLMKPKTQCPLTHLPLRGFSWISNNSTEFEPEPNKWKSEPLDTCTNTICGLLSVTYVNSKVDSWQLDSKVCKSPYPFICKHKGQSEKKPCPNPIIAGPHDIMQKMNDPYTLHVACQHSGTDNFTLTCSRSTRKWTLVGSTETDVSQLCQGCRKGFRKNVHGNCVDVDKCKHLHMCKHHCNNTEGSNICKCPDGMVEDSKNCEEAGNLSPSMSSSNDTAFQDKRIPPSMEKSHPPSSQPEIPTEVDTLDQSNIIIPVIIALLIFVVLVVIAVGIVKCCLIRRAKKRAKKRAEASKESMALNGADSI